MFKQTDFKTVYKQCKIHVDTKLGIIILQSVPFEVPTKMLTLGSIKEYSLAPSITLLFWSALMMKYWKQSRRKIILYYRNNRNCWCVECWWSMQKWSNCWIETLRNVSWIIIMLVNLTYLRQMPVERHEVFGCQ
mgnify:CR=1 FL=1